MGLTLSLSCHSKLVQDELKMETEPCLSVGHLAQGTYPKRGARALWGPTQGTCLKQRDRGMP